MWIFAHTQSWLHVSLRPGFYIFVTCICIFRILYNAVENVEILTNIEKEEEEEDWISWIYQEVIRGWYVCQTSKIRSEFKNAHNGVIVLAFFLYSLCILRSAQWYMIQNSNLEK